MINDTRDTKGLKQLGARKVEYKSLPVEELLFEVDANTNKLVWVWNSFNDMVIEGAVNPVFSKDFNPNSDDGMAECLARISCGKAFGNYWFDSEGKQTKRNWEDYQKYSVS